MPMHEKFYREYTFLRISLAVALAAIIRQHFQDIYGIHTCFIGAYQCTRCRASAFRLP